MNNQNPFILSLITAKQLFTALRERIETGDLPTEQEGILDAIEFYETYFEGYQETGSAKEQIDAELCLKYIPLMRSTLKWREERSKVIFYCEL